MESNQPILPYAGTSGWSGSQTSKDRAVRNDKDGTTSRNQIETYWRVNASAEEGLTWKELSDATGWHHGTASGVLSVLHKAERIVRLKETRNRCAVYVVIDEVHEREVVERKIKCCKNCGAEQ